ncbi:MAG: hypothetical protein D6754_05410 [Alphaproteobacteria bacterium]|nr:MAG: hypothetical protein D6754_05410 [Alphaproteobacteria bacterium]
MLYFALSYDGLEQWEPPHEAEADALAAFHRHQRGDKGFGPALGPDGVAVLATMLRERGYRVDLSPSPWQLTQADHRLIEALAEGAALAVSETGLLPEAVVAEWFAARCRARRVTIGHVDLLAIPPG